MNDRVIVKISNKRLLHRKVYSFRQYKLFVGSNLQVQTDDLIQNK